jgi:hypothetical protein
MKLPENTTPETWHRYFGSRANNTAWELAERPPSEVDTRALLNAAHAAAWHWEHIGTQQNRMRALMLLAEAHARAGLGASALAYSEEMRRHFLAAADTPDWEIAFVHVVHAHAAFAAGAQELHDRAHAAAVTAVAAIADEEDREIVQRVLRHVPAP